MKRIVDLNLSWGNQLEWQLWMWMFEVHISTFVIYGTEIAQVLHDFQRIFGIYGE